MTSKEFLRRTEFFKVLDSAAGYFYSGNYNHIYHVQGSTFAGIRINIFQNRPYTNYLSPSFLNDCYWISVTSFSRAAFELKLGNFKRFLSRLSSHQRSILESSREVDNLLKFCDEN